MLRWNKAVFSMIGTRISQKPKHSNILRAVISTVCQAGESRGKISLIPLMAVIFSIVKSCFLSGQMQLPGKFRVGFRITFT
jgi:hypothetical protein